MAKPKKLHEPIPALVSVKLAEIGIPSEWWRLPDPAVTLKVQASVRLYGQVKPLVVYRGVERGELLLLAGRGLLIALQALGREVGLAVDLGPMSPIEATCARLALEVQARTDSEALAHEVAAAVRDGANVDHLASVGPFTGERIRHFVTLSTWDWSQFEPVSDGQSAISWDEEELNDLEEAMPTLAKPVVALDVPFVDRADEQQYLFHAEAAADRLAKKETPAVDSTSTGQLGLW